MGPDGGGAPAPGEIRVLVTDDDPLVRAGLRMMLDGRDTAGPSGGSGTRRIAVVGEAGDGDEVDAAVRACAPDVVLMDLRMPRCNGVVATQRLRREPDAPAVVVLTTFDGDEHILGALRAGAGGYLLKDSPPELLAAAVRAAADGDAVLSPAVTHRLIALAAGPGDGGGPADAARRLARLGDREREVARAVGRGLSNADIAAELHMGVGTVKAHVSRALNRLGLDNRVQLALLVHGIGG